MKGQIGRANAHSDHISTTLMASSSLAELHKRLRHLEKTGASQVDIESIKAHIRAQLPAVDTARSQPHKKTPSGRTKALHMNYMHSQTDTSGQAELEYLRFFARTFSEIGIRLEILTDVGCQAEIEQEFSKDAYKTLDYAVTLSQAPVSKWAEDSVEYLQNGHIAVLRWFDENLLEWAMTVGRRERWQQKVTPETLAAILENDQAWILLGTRVNALQTGLERERLAQAQGQPVGHIRAYIEGGNMIAGEDVAGHPVILIGKDAIAATAHIYQLNQGDVKQLICEDFRLDNTDQVIAVEQPGKFHLDMGMLFIGHGVVILNDSRATLKDALEMATLAPCQTTEQKAMKLQLQCSLEDDAAQDLQAAGLEVRRERLENDVFYNFFNGEFVEGADGLNYYITNGGLKEQEDRFETLMVNEWTVVQKVFFSPQTLSQKGLRERGGVGCRLKGSR